MNTQLSEISSVLITVLSLVAVMVTFFIVVKIAKWISRGDAGSKYTGWDYDSRSSGMDGDKWMDVERYYREGKPTGRVRKHYRKDF